FGFTSAGTLSQSSFFTTVPPVSTVHGRSSMYFAFSKMCDEYAYSGASATVSIIPVCSDGTMSVDEITTGWKPPARHAAADAGSPSQQNCLDACISASVAIFFDEKKRTKPTSLQPSTT